MSKILTFDVSVDEINTYALTEVEFNEINEENKLGLDIDNLSEDDIATLYSYLSCDNITDNTTNFVEIHEHEIVEEEV